MGVENKSEHVSVLEERGGGGGVETQERERETVTSVFAGRTEERLPGFLRFQ